MHRYLCMLKTHEAAESDRSRDCGISKGVFNHPMRDSSAAHTVIASHCCNTQLSEETPICRSVKHTPHRAHLLFLTKAQAS